MVGGLDVGLDVRRAVAFVDGPVDVLDFDPVGLVASRDRGHGHVCAALTGRLLREMS